MEPSDSGLPEQSRLQSVVRGWLPLIAAAFVALALQGASALGVETVDWFLRLRLRGVVPCGLAGIALGALYEASLKPSSAWDSFVFAGLALPGGSAFLLGMARMATSLEDGWWVPVAILLAGYVAAMFLVGGLGGAVGGAAVRGMRPKTVL